jgi:hypothetical protein
MRRTTMDPTNILYPRNRFADEEKARRIEPSVREIYAEMDIGALADAAQSRPQEPETAAERLAEALAPNIVEMCKLRTAAENFTERSVRAVERPLKLHRTLAWKTAWAAEYIDLYTRLRGLTKAHKMMVHALRLWRVAPGLGDDDAALTAILNGLARTLNEVVALLDTAGKASVARKAAAA